MEEESWRRYSGERASALARQGEDRGVGDRLIGVKPATHTYRIHSPTGMDPLPMQPPFPTPSTRRLARAPHFPGAASLPLISDLPGEAERRRADVVRGSLPVKLLGAQRDAYVEPQRFRP